MYPRALLRASWGITALISLIPWQLPLACPVQAVLCVLWGWAGAALRRGAHLYMGCCCGNECGRGQHAEI